MRPRAAWADAVLAAHRSADVAGSVGSVAWWLLSSLLQQLPVQLPLDRDIFCGCVDSIAAAASGLLAGGGDWCRLLYFIAGLLAVPLADATVFCRRRALAYATELHEQVPTARRPQVRLRRPPLREESFRSDDAPRRRGRSQSVGPSRASGARRHP